MSYRTITLAFTIFNFCLSSVVQAATPLEIRDKLYQLHVDLQQSLANPQELDDVLIDLNRAQQTLRNATGNPVPSQRCLDYTYEKYLINHTSAVATQKSHAACRIIHDLDIAQSLYNYYFVSYTSGHAMDEAANRAGRDMLGKSAILQYAYEKYFINYTSARAADAAAQGTSGMLLQNFNCLRSSFDRFYQNYTAARAMDEAFSVCR